jgi:hypothetical protein
MGDGRGWAGCTKLSGVAKVVFAMGKVFFLRFGVAMTAAVLGAGIGLAETCTTQSQMKPADYSGIQSAARALATNIQAGDIEAVRAATIVEYAMNFGGMKTELDRVSPKIKGGAVVVDQVYLLDGTNLKPNDDGSAPDAQFFCALNRSTNEADFAIPSLPVGRYAFAMVEVESPLPWRLSMLMRQDAGKWMLAGFYPRALTANGHDGLWYWTQARTLKEQKHPWDAWLYYQEAQTLLEPASFVDSTHLEKLRQEEMTSAPQPVSQGLGPDVPLVVKAADGTEYRFTGISVDTTLDQNRLDIAVRLKVDSVGDAAAARTRNIAAMKALLAAYPELRTGFYGVWMFSEAPGQSLYGTELSMSQIP